MGACISIVFNLTFIFPNLIRNVLRRLDPDSNVMFKAFNIFKSLIYSSKAI